MQNESLDNIKNRITSIKGSVARRFGSCKWIIASFFVSLFAALICFAFASLWPFGGRSLMSMDAWGQYYPMLRELKNALADGNLFFSFNGGLGFDVLSQISYYTGSPFWLILVTFPETAFTAVIHIIEIFKFALAGMTFAILLEKKFGKSGILQVAFSVSYAFSAYTVAFVNQIMWFDAVIFLPLVVLGIDRLCGMKKPLLYFISLSLTVISNFYIGFIVCVFSLLYFIAQEITSKRTAGEHFGSALRFGIYSLLSGGASAVFLLPVYFSIQNTAAATLGFDGELKFYHSFAEFVENMTPFSKISLEYGMANLYCGILPLVLFFAFLFCKRIPLFKRIVFGGFTAFMIVSFELNLLDFIWHGFHYPNQLPGRQSFVYVLLILMLAYEAAINFDSVGIRAVAVAAIIPAVVFYAAYIIESGNASAADFAGRTLISGLVFILLYASVLLIGRSPRSKIICELLPGILSFIVIVETVSSAAFMFTTQTRATAYDSLTVFDKTMSAVTEKYESGEDDLYRTEWMPTYQFNPGMMYGYKGITYYSSMMSKGAYEFFLNCGYPIYAKNVSTRYVVSPILDAMLGIRYVYERAYATYPGYSTVENIDTFTILENESSLPLIFMADEKIRSFGDGISGECTGFDYQNELFISTGATDEALYTRLEPSDEVLQNAVLRKQQGEIYYKRINSDLPVSSVIKYEIPTSGEYYICTKLKAGTITVFVNGEEYKTLDPSSNPLPYVGSFSEGDYVTLNFTSQGYGFAVYGIELYRFDREEYEAGIAILKERSGEIESASRSRITVKINAGEGGTLYAAIPYNGGWSLDCDGESIPLHSVADFLTCADLPAGEHILTLTYVSPGFIPGIIISIASVLIAITTEMLIRSKKTKK